MGDRKCPYCGERVPSFSVNCPNCYRSLPGEERQQETYRIIDDDRAPSVYRVDRRVVAFLAFIPAVFGLFGLGQMYHPVLGIGQRIHREFDHGRNAVDGSLVIQFTF